ncbi:hypothetical protein PHISCL_08640 [Aspergillus sclerotialis]|uniref:BZIP domain-containing protein n=1 Tax=Aspergillus sclerotialis TaxID=2070753 RepID=A0A3A2ZCJ7_9EURO|nr:hypothetical protein PHISCL_08640 [Aspergillus sclerotialis]
MDSSSQKNLARLARIRENQRRSRAKKQEYVHELEQKLANFQEEARQKDVQHRLAVQKLTAENRKLRYLLSLSGLPSHAIEEYLRDVDEPAMERKVAIPALSGNASHSPAARPAGSEAREQPIPVETQGAAHDVKELRQPRQCQSVCDCPSTYDEDQWPADEDVLNTTLCAIADELISQYNTRGVDRAEIQRKLWDGFRKGLNTGEGCRVQNQLLFQVLDEISND